MKLLVRWLPRCRALWLMLSCCEVLMFEKLDGLRPLLLGNVDGRDAGNAGCVAGRVVGSVGVVAGRLVGNVVGVDGRVVGSVGVVIGVEERLVGSVVGVDGRAVGSVGCVDGRLVGISAGKPFCQPWFVRCCQPSAVFLKTLPSRSVKTLLDRLFAAAGLTRLAAVALSAVAMPRARFCGVL